MDNRAHRPRSQLNPLGVDARRVDPAEHVSALQLQPRLSTGGCCSCKPPTQVGAYSCSGDSLQGLLQLYATAAHLTAFDRSAGSKLGAPPLPPPAAAALFG